MLTYSTIIFILITTVIVVWGLACIISSRRIAKYKQTKITAWKKTLDVKKLIPDETLLAEALEKWKWDFDYLLKVYMQACEKLGIKAVADVTIMEKVLKEYPPFLTSPIYHKVEFKNNELLYHFVNVTETRKLTLPITVSMLQKPYFISHDYRGNYYYVSGGWDY